MTGTIQQNEETPSSHIGSAIEFEDLNKMEKKLTIELVKEFCNEDCKCETKRCFAQTYFAGKCAVTLPQKFFYAFLFEDIEESKKIAIQIATLPRQYIVAALANLGFGFWNLYDHMLQIDPELETRVRNTYQKWVEEEFEKEIWQ